MHYVLLYLSMIPVFVALDLLWLGIVARDMYQTRLAHLLGPVEWYAAAMFYAIFLLGVLLFVVLPGIERGMISHVILWGAFFALVTYGTYDLTNLATLRNWPVGLSFIDMAWGAALAALTSSWGYVVATRFLNLG